MPRPPPKLINQSELNRLAQQLHDLREALRPFAVFAESLPTVEPGASRVTDVGPMIYASVVMKDYVLSYAHLRDAKALLDRLEAEDAARVIENAELRLAGFDCEHCGNRVVPVVGGLVGYCSLECQEAEHKLCLAEGRQPRC